MVRRRRAHGSVAAEPHCGATAEAHICTAVGMRCCRGAQSSVDGVCERGVCNVNGGVTAEAHGCRLQSYIALAIAFPSMPSVRELKD